jgi:hypothetical protein
MRGMARMKTYTASQARERFAEILEAVEQGEEVAITKHAELKRRAQEFGLARTKELPWSQPELTILSRYAWMSDDRVRLKLKAAGYTRTVTAIHLELKRMKVELDGSFWFRMAK